VRDVSAPDPNHFLRAIVFRAQRDLSYWGWKVLEELSYRTEWILKDQSLLNRCWWCCRRILFRDRCQILFGKLLNTYRISLSWRDMLFSLLIFLLLVMWNRFLVQKDLRSTWSSFLKFDISRPAQTLIYLDYILFILLSSSFHEILWLLYQAFFPLLSHIVLDCLS